MPGPANYTVGLFLQCLRVPANGAAWQMISAPHVTVNGFAGRLGQIRTAPAIPSPSLRAALLLDGGHCATSRIHKPALSSQFFSASEGTADVAHLHGAMIAGNQNGIFIAFDQRFSRHQFAAADQPISTAMQCPAGTAVKARHGEDGIKRFQRGYVAGSSMPTAAAMRALVVTQRLRTASNCHRNRSGGCQRLGARPRQSCAMHHGNRYRSRRPE